MTFTELRKKYENFYYRSFEIQEEEAKIQVTYTFEIEGLGKFTPTFTIPKKPGMRSFAQTVLIRKCAFSLGMVELASYWKISCAPHVRVECGSLDPEQIVWWKKLYFNGLGEFFYRNGIETDPESFMDLQASGPEIAGAELKQEYQGNLIPVGGGKDSFVTLELLKDMDNVAFVINPVKSAVHAVQAAGYTGDRFLLVNRTLDPLMLELNKQGYLNGHTPFSALAAFASFFSAVVYGRRYICLSNEASANESTIKGSSVNHQYSKTYAFEQDFRWYSAKYLTTEVSYFSFLRPLSELQIAGLFAGMPQYHAVFRSCNVGQKEEKWCGHCAKCLFVCIMMNAYLSEEETAKIFGKDMLQDETMLELFEQLTGLLDDKPFECVGTRDEVNTAVAMAMRRMKELPYLYAYYQKSPYYAFYKDKTVDMVAYREPNSLPPEYADILKAALQRRNHETGLD